MGADVLHHTVLQSINATHAQPAGPAISEDLHSADEDANLVVDNLLSLAYAACTTSPNPGHQEELDRLSNESQGLTQSDGSCHQLRDTVSLVHHRIALILNSS